MRKGVSRAPTPATQTSTSSPTTASINKGNKRHKRAAWKIRTAFSWTATKLREAIHTAILYHQLYRRWCIHVQTNLIVSKRLSKTWIKGGNLTRTYPRCSKNKNSSRLQMHIIASTKARTSWATKPSHRRSSTIWNSGSAKLSLKRKLA